MQDGGIDRLPRGIGPAAHSAVINVLLHPCLRRKPRHAMPCAGRHAGKGIVSKAAQAIVTALL